jgi:hypothetical protein
LEAACRIVAGSAGDTRFGSYTTALVLAAALRRISGRDPRLRRLVALLTYSAGEHPRPEPSLAIKALVREDFAG